MGQDLARWSREEQERENRRKALERDVYADRLRRVVLLIDEYQRDLQSEGNPAAEHLAALLADASAIAISQPDSEPARDANSLPWRSFLEQNK